MCKGGYRGCLVHGIAGALEGSIRLTEDCARAYTRAKACTRAAGVDQPDQRPKQRSKKDVCRSGLSPLVNCPTIHWAHSSVLLASDVSSHLLPRAWGYAHELCLPS